jgi:hypothetical protein
MYVGSLYFNMTGHNFEVRHLRCVSNKSDYKVYAYIVKTQLYIRWYDNYYMLKIYRTFRSFHCILQISVLSNETNVTYTILISCVSHWSYSLRAGRSEGRTPVGSRFSAPIQIGPRANSASYTMGTGSFLGVKRSGRGVDHPPPSSAEVK